MAKKKPGRKKGSTFVYTNAVAEEICQRLAEGESLTVICRDAHLPAKSTVLAWAQTHATFKPMYDRARELQLSVREDEILDIADDSFNDYVERESNNGEIKIVYNPDHVQRCKLRIDTRMWVLKNLRPDIYGDRVKQELTGKGGGPIETKETSDMELARQVGFLLGKVAAKKNEPTR